MNLFLFQMLCEQSIDFLFSRQETDARRKRDEQRWSPRGRPWPRGRPRGQILKSLALASKVKSLALASRP